MSASDLITWDSVGDLIVKTFQNPYLCCMIISSALSFVGVLTDPTTAGIGDSSQALTYTEPREG
jgi:phi LC3 family holin